MKISSIASATYVLATLLLIASGCSHLTHKQHRDQAQQSWDQVRAKVKLQLATQLYDTGHAKEAARSAMEAVALYRTFHDAYVLLVRAHLELGELAQADRSLQGARQAGVDSASLVYLEGVLHEQRGEPAQALACYRQAGRENPHELDYIVAQVECLVALGDPASALQTVREHRRRLDHDGTLATLGARIAEMLDDTDAAEQMYRDAIRACGSRSLSLDYGLMLIRDERYAQARIVLEPLLRGKLGGLAEGALRRAIARCHLALDYPAGALEVLDDYARLHRDDQAVQLLRATAALMQGDHYTALQAAHAVLDRNPHDGEALLVIAAAKKRRSP